MIKRIFVIVSLLLSQAAQAQQIDPMVRQYLPPMKVLWMSEDTGRHIRHPEWLLRPGNGQPDLSGRPVTHLLSDSAVKPAILLDFGRELHGGLQLVTGFTPKDGMRPARLRLRFGESASEAMSEIGATNNATNDHAIRDMIVEVPRYGKLEVGNTGFRFVRIDLIDSSANLALKEVRAIFVHRDLTYKGSFHCSDSLLDKIWLTGAYTVQLNMQDYLWDGIKRDRLVWVGDMHPETSTISAVFGDQDVVPKSLDLVRDITPQQEWMNGISTYSMWWIIIHRDWYLHQGNLTYLKQQKAYLLPLLQHILQRIDSSNSESLNGMRFLDWPSYNNAPAVHAGLQAMMILSLQAGEDLCKWLQEPAAAQQCAAGIVRLREHVPGAHGSKQAAALLSLAGLAPAKDMNDTVLAVGGPQHFSTFFGYYMLQAIAKAGDYNTALADIRRYWGGMLQMGATSFWEDFDIDWMAGASRIDALPQPGQKDIHGDYGGYCYKGFRHSLCHGWASGPTPWLTEYVLGIQVKQPGCKVIAIHPHLGDLQFAEGHFPTPYGILYVKHVKQADGHIRTTVKAPPGVQIAR
ncbi:alpha-L-rhamnosidase [Chitinophaga costaii]|uniref:Alpha-L-rhamnosidase n=1 Tax=Chitinophaga costaii TaxID=1335309 RepID=A0A1C4DU24_9BACT|nr:alpha-L-rhamnosidase C-terminal domain-containing protein [Chitinophaga costaii]PUZ27794.1 alpha-L-rhamnosidase [Chitinophaga costaii]SCC34878.1 alpha-L-rhamnosidase [Chitinophaga costaii]